MVGRHLGKDRAAGLCTLCTNKSIGDDHHYLFECGIFQKEQMQFLESRLMRYPIDRRMAKVLDAENAKIGLFIGKTMEVFKSIQVHQTCLPAN